MLSQPPRESPPDELAGTTVGDRFELLSFAAKGGMGRVYRARDRTTGATVAVKLLTESRGDAARFAREAGVLASIDHPGVVRYLSHGEAPGGAPYLAMEWLSGKDLADRLEDSTLSVDETLRVARRIAGALAAAHRRGVVHRDIKPANLFLVGGSLESLKLLDFGVAFALDDVDLTSTGMLVGTPAYMSPEQVRGEVVDPRADIYGLGAVLFRCLAGQPPFLGAHRLAVLAKVLLEPLTPIRELCPEVPIQIEELLTRLLSKDREQRPADGAALAEELEDLAAPSSRHLRRARAAVTAREQRVACVILCARSTSEDETVSDDGGGDGDVRRAIEQRGGSIDALARGAWVITIPGGASPSEDATRAARCALALAKLRPHAPVFVATGHMVVTGQRRVGEVIDRAADALVRSRRITGEGGVRIDAATAALLEGRFRVRGEEEWLVLASEESAVAPVRMLLGKPAPCIGRETQLAMLSTMLKACAEESRASAALVTAAPGLGKTHLLHELLRTSVAPRELDVDLLFARGDPMRSGSAFGIAGDIIKRAAHVLDSDAAPVRAQKLSTLVARDFSRSDAVRQEELLGEISGILTAQKDASPALRAARDDVSVMADAIREAWIDWIAARTRQPAGDDGEPPRAARPGHVAMIVVEDLQWADSTSVRLVETALAGLEDRPVFFLATSREDGAALLSDRFRARGLVELTLAPLSRGASERLIRGALGQSADAALVNGLLKRAGGHPFHLEELVRAVAAGRGADALPDTILGMVQARLDDLDPKARLLLRAASVFGDPFWSGGITALMGDDMPAHEVERILGGLVARELLTEQGSSKWSKEREFRFRHALLRDGAYATLAERDRVRAHKRAATWLESMGEDDAAVLAEHYDRGAAPEQASTFFRRAAAEALQHNDFERATAHASRARAVGADSATLATLGPIEAEILYWRGELPDAAARAARACKELPRGSQEWFDAASVTLAALGQLGQNEGVAEWLEEVAAATSPDESRGAHVVALCRGMTQLFWAHHAGDLSKIRARLDRLVDGADGLDPFHTGWVHRVRGESAWLHEGHVDRSLEELELSCSDFRRARAIRALCLTRLNAATLAGWSGEISRGLEWLALSRSEAERLGASFLLDYARAVEGLLLAFAGDSSAESTMRGAALALEGSPRLSFLCHVVVGWLAMDRGDARTAEAEATAALKITVAPELRAAGLALGARVAISRDQIEEGVRMASEAFSVESTSQDLDVTFGIAGVTLAEALVASGATNGALRVLGTVKARLAVTAATISAPAQRERFWHRPLPNATLLKLVTQLEAP